MELEHAGYGNPIMQRDARATASRGTGPTGIPEKPGLEGLEATWSARWEEAGTYAFDRSAPREQVYSIDTPPPTVSGSLHIGHVFSYTHTDTVARFHRMRGRAVFYPMGWDDNGLPTERRVQNYFGVRCDPGLPYDPTSSRRPQPGKDPISVSRPNFVELCHRLTAEDEQAFEHLWRTLGLSVDWSHTYATVADAGPAGLPARLPPPGRPGPGGPADRAHPVGRRLPDRGVPGRAGGPRAARRLPPAALPTGRGGGCGRDRDHPARAARRLRGPGGPSRRRALPAALRHRGAHAAVRGAGAGRWPTRWPTPTRDSGIAMICTFGDTTDVVWWRELGLPTRTIVGRDGRLLPVDVGHRGVGVRRPRTAAARLRASWRAARSSRPRSGSSSCWPSPGALVGEPQPDHPPGQVLREGRPAARDRLVPPVVRRAPCPSAIDSLAQGRGAALAPALHGPPLPGLGGGPQQRLEHQPAAVLRGALSGLVPGRRRRARSTSTAPIFAAEDRLPGRPVDRRARRATREDQRGRPGGFVGDPDVMDTWATSSLTPQIAGGWEDDPDLFARVFPMDLRPQAHEIIRTWLFSTVVRSELEHGSLPWTDAAISGWVLDPDRKKMSKSQGERGDPAPPAREARRRRGPLLGGQRPAGDRHRVRRGPDEGGPAAGHQGPQRLAVRARADRRRRTAGGGPGPGRGHRPPRPAPCWPAWPRWSTRPPPPSRATTTPGPSSAPRRFFWSFCDDYLELVKTRAYGDAGRPGPASARAALALALSVQLRLLAPFLPFVTEEVWSWWQAGSIHTAAVAARAVRARRPALARQGRHAAGPVLEVVAEVLGQVRRAKTAAKRSMRAPVATLTVADTPERLAALLGRPRATSAMRAACCPWSRPRPIEPTVEVVLADEA